jgi:hypothetical protein
MGQNSGLLSSLTDWNGTLAGYADSISTGVVMPVALTLLALFMILELYNATQRIAMNGSNNAFTIQQIALVMLKIVVCRWAVVHTTEILNALFEVASTVTVGISGYVGSGEVNTTVDIENGNHYDLIYTLAGSSWYESVTGQQRHYTLQPLEMPPENYEPKPAQVGVYLSAPVGFSQHVIVYLQNLYTDDVYDLELYESNGLAAVEPNALSGKYTFLSAYVVGDAENRYQFNCEQNELSTETGADFHLTVTDTASPDREMNTPSRDQNSTVQAANSFNNRNTDAPQQSTTQPEIVSQPVKQQKKQLDLLSLLLDFMPVVLVGAVLFAVRRKHRR